MKYHLKNKNFGLQIRTKVTILFEKSSQLYTFIYIKRQIVISSNCEPAKNENMVGDLFSNFKKKCVLCRFKKTTEQ